MLKDYFHVFFNEDMLPEQKNFNIAVSFVFGTYIIAAVSAFIMNLRPFFYIVLLLTVIFTVVSVYFGTRTRQFNVWAFVISIVINLMELPAAYIADGRTVCAASLYFILGIFFCTFTIRGILSVVSVSIGFVSYALSALYVYMNDDPAVRLGYGQIDLAADIIVPVIICSAVSGMSVYFKYRIYQHEKDKAENEKMRSMEVDHSKDVFLMNMSHEIRTPMNAIIGESELLLSKDIDESMKQNVVYILNACDALLSSINDILDFSKVENADIVLNEAEYGIRDIITDIVNMISVRLMDSDISFYVDADPCLPSKMYGDAARLRQLLINLLNNAVKYTRNGSISLIIKARTDPDDTAVLNVDVADTGIGIKQEDIGKLFNAFQRIDDDRNGNRMIEGTGLGLSICKEILNREHGEISVKSEYNKGSVFSFTLPQKIADRSPMVDIASAGKKFCVLLYEDDEEKSNLAGMAFEKCRVTYTSADSDESFRIQYDNGIFTHIFISVRHYDQMKDYIDETVRTDVTVVLISDINTPDVKEKGTFKVIRPVYCINIAEILSGDRAKRNRAGNVSADDSYMGFTAMVIDDNSTNLAVAEGLLKKYGMNVIKISSGHDALNIIESEKADIIFIDYMMPEMDGIDTLKCIRASGQKWCSGVPCIVLTADAAEGAEEMLLSAGFDGYISKPVDIKKLDVCIHAFLGEDPGRREALCRK